MSIMRDIIHTFIHSFIDWDNYIVVFPGGVAVPPQQPVPARPPPQPITDADVTMVKDMFPNIDDDVVRSVLEANQGDKDATINNLLAMESS